MINIGDEFMLRYYDGSLIQVAVRSVNEMHRSLGPGLHEVYTSYTCSNQIYGDNIEVSDAGQFLSMVSPSGVPVGLVTAYA